MIKIEVFTNIDEDKHIIFPQHVSCHPRIGERIKSIDTKHSRRICSITHSVYYEVQSLLPMLILEVTR